MRYLDDRIKEIDEIRRLVIIQTVLLDIYRAEIVQACKEFRVKELHVFGSVLEKSLSEARDVDLIVEFDREGYEGAFDQFMGFKEKMESILGRPVDLITQKRFRNPLFQEEVDRQKEAIYAA